MTSHFFSVKPCTKIGVHDFFQNYHCHKIHSFIVFQCLKERNRIPN